ncbi:MAG TPA: RNB domain-containing ribonuclease [Acidobacteriaceae bacterium]|nr:RNB domain-containing ribonuclease [Acidobacteriaceae bacterium]
MSEHHRHRHEKNEGTQQQADQSAGPAHQQHGHGGHQHVDPDHFDLAQAALDEMHEAGFKPEFGPGVGDQVNEIRERLREEFAKAQPGFGVPDLRSLCWSSIDNDTSRDLDQIEVAERVADGIRVHVAIGDVARAVEKESPIDQHAKAQTQTIYTAVKNFPMLPLELSTGMTSLNENGDRMAVMMSFTVGANGEMSDEQISRAWVRNRGQLAYSRVGPWLDAHAGATTATGVSLQDVEGLRSDSARQSEDQNGPAFVDDDEGRELAEELANQLLMQATATQALHRARIQNGALEFHRGEAEPVIADGHVVSVHDVIQNQAMYLIEDLMVAANGVMARALRKGGRSGLQRVVRVPQRWDRIVALAAEHHWELPANPDSQALNNLLAHVRATDPDHYPDVAVAVIKLMGAGEYMVMTPDDDPTGHFGLAVRDYTHSTAPNRRFPDMVTQRVLHAMMDGEAAPYSDAELAAIATHCNEADKALRKIERDMRKRVAAVALAHRIGEVFRGVIAGASDKGVYVRVIDPPVEGRVVQNFEGLDVGDRVSVKLLHTDPARAFIDFAKVSGNQNGARS